MDAQGMFDEPYQQSKIIHGIPAEFLFTFP
jgi:hypothetical protein